MQALEREGLELVVPTLVIAEATHLVGRRLGPKAEAAFLRRLAQVEVEPPLPDDWERIAHLVDEYADLSSAAPTRLSWRWPSAWIHERGHHSRPPTLQRRAPSAS